MRRSARPELSLLFLPVLCFILALPAAAAERPVDSLLEPVLRLPPAAKAPVIDGRIDEKEWADAAMMEGSVGSADQALEERRAWAYITYDKDNLYVAIRSVTRPGGKLFIWDHDPDEALMRMDGVEIWVAPLRDPLQPPIDNFQLWYDPYGTQWGLVHRYGAGFNVQEKLPVGTKIIGNEWHFELAFPWRLAKLKPEDIRDGRQVLVRPCRNWRYHFLYSTWGGAGAFYLKTNMVRVIMDSKAPVVRVPDLGDLFGGKANVKVEVVNTTVKPVEVEATISVGPADQGAREPKDLAKPLKTDTKRLTVQPGRTASVVTSAVFDPVPLLPAREMYSQRRTSHYSLKLDVTRVSDRAVLFSRFFRIPGRRNEQWSTLPARATKLSGGYYPYFGKLRAEIDLGDDPRAANVTRAVVHVRTDAGKPAGQGEIKSFLYGRGQTVIDVGALPDGKYTMTADIYAGDRKLAYEKAVTRSFTRERQPWEGNRIGVSEKVYPPFTPIEVKGSTVSCVLRDHEMNALGLWDQVVAKGRPILAGPMRLECRSGGKTLAWKVPAAPRFTEKAAHEATLEGQGACAALTVKMHCLWEYDGMMKVDMDLTPAGAARVDGLELVIPVKADIATLMHSTTATRSNPSMAIPAGDGIVWDSRGMVQTVGKGSFTPYIWIGGPERGVCWFADNDHGWITDDHEPAIRIERTDGAVNLRVRFINRPGVVKAPRRIVFGLMATPVKPIPAESRAWWADASSPRCYCTCLSSWRFAGFSSGETLTPLGGDFSIFAYFARHQGTRKRSKEQQEYLFNWMKKYREDPNRGKLFAQLLKTFYTTVGTDEAVYYTNPALESGGTPQGRQFGNEWKSGIAGMGCNFVRSYNDYAAWCYDQMLAGGLRCGVYQDNTFPVASTDVIAGSAYVREDGRIQAGWNIFGHREFYKRLFVTGWQRLGRMPLIYPHTTNGMAIPQFSFATIHLALEWEQHSLRTFQEKFMFALLRTEVMGKQAGLIPRILCGMGDPSPDRSPAARAERDKLNACLHRTREGVLLLHDSFPRSHGPYMGDVVRLLMPFGFHKESCRFVGYWEKPTLVRAPGTVAVSLFKMDQALLAVVVDTSGRDGLRTITIDEKAIGRPVGNIRDFERFCIDEYNRAGGPNHNARAAANLTRYAHPDNQFKKAAGNAVQMNIRKHDYVLLLVE